MQTILTRVNALAKVVPLKHSVHLRRVSDKFESFVVNPRSRYFSFSSQFCYGSLQILVNRQVCARGLPTLEILSRDCIRSSAVNSGHCSWVMTSLFAQAEERFSEISDPYFWGTLGPQEGMGAWYGRRAPIQLASLNGFIVSVRFLVYFSVQRSVA